jgi:hypothetical protein
MIELFVERLSRELVIDSLRRTQEAVLSQFSASPQSR